ncbi:hypothetical protein ACRALDRAFT_212561 [Sodiomyces alcalophilus JCM 7366]|uniref:uncharacterized protein n=1 Tax=Sodiomyces alcalophilus JCM 7366 TaxID=591952 RepID=UPI0039B67620
MRATGAFYAARRYPSLTHVFPSSRKADRLLTWKLGSIHCPWTSGRNTHHGFDCTLIFAQQSRQFVIISARNRRQAALVDCLLNRHPSQRMRDVYEYKSHFPFHEKTSYDLNERHYSLSNGELRDWGATMRLSYQCRYTPLNCTFLCSGAGEHESQDRQHGETIQPLPSRPLLSGQRIVSSQGSRSGGVSPVSRADVCTDTTMSWPGDDVRFTLAGRPGDRPNIASCSNPPNLDFDALPCQSTSLRTLEAERKPPNAPHITIAPAAAYLGTVPMDATAENNLARQTRSPICLV